MKKNIYFLSMMIFLCCSQAALARVRPVTIQFPFKDKLYIYKTTVGNLLKKDNPIIIENNRLYVKYDGPRSFKKVTIRNNKERIEEVPNELYEKFIYIGTVEALQDEQGTPYYKYIDDPETPSFKLVTEDNDVVYEDTPSDAKITGITFFQSIAERDNPEPLAQEKLEKLRKYEKEYFDVHDLKVKREKLDEDIQKTKEEIIKLQKLLDKLKEERKTCE